jgi:DUF1365 family protein
LKKRVATTPGPFICWPTGAILDTRTIPIAVYYCYDKPGGACCEYVVAEVTNTPWGERHSYVLEAPAQRPLATEFDKALHVSPFNPMNMTYRWYSNAPGMIADSDCAL